MAFDSESAKKAREKASNRGPGKFPKMVKDVVADVFTVLQTDEGKKKKVDLQSWAEENPTEFYKLASKLIPVQLTGDADNPVAVNITEGMTFDQLYQLKYGKKP